MKIAHLENMSKGWFIGNFEPTLLHTNDFEVAVKEYKKGSYEPVHYHKLSREITVIVVGMVRMNGQKFSKGDIIITSLGLYTET